MYLDPGFGGMLLQVVIALAAVGGAIIFSLRRKIKNLFSKKKDEETKVESAAFKDVAEDDMIDTLDD
ncbi:MAG: hypothetical protein FWE27_06690 [Defluviitaleaceae bacterium]|nr:hypothetical protein [Defluviitaleaceae bacterium]